MILVTGSAGHVGNVLVRHLTSKGLKVRALVMPSEDIASLEGVKVEIARADITDIDSLDAVFENIEYVYHLAGIVAIAPGQKKMLEQVNVEGTNNIIASCRKHGVKRLVYFSSIHAYEEPEDGGRLDEKQSFLPEKIVGEYGRSKARASLAVMQAVKDGLDAVIVAPTGIIGPYDFKLSEMGQLFTELYKQHLPILIHGAYDFVDVRDIAIGVELVRTKGKTGDSYILGGERIEINKIAKVLADATGVRAPRYILPTWIAKIIAPFATLYYTLLGKKPILSLYAIYTLNIKYSISDQKARQELGYVSRPIKESIVDAVNWLKENSWN